MAPVWQGDCGRCLSWRVGCSHVSGLFVRHVMTAGPDVFRLNRSLSNYRAVVAQDITAGSSVRAAIPLCCHITPLSLRQLLCLERRCLCVPVYAGIEALLLSVLPADNSASAPYRPCDAGYLLASAAATSLKGLFDSRRRALFARGVSAAVMIHQAREPGCLARCATGGFELERDVSPSRGGLLVNKQHRPTHLRNKTVRRGRFSAKIFERSSLQSLLGALLRVLFRVKTLAQRAGCGGKTASPFSWFRSTTGE